MYAMTGLWFESALLPSGWARHVRIAASDGNIERVTVDTQAQPGDERHAIALPGLPNVHSHAFQRGLAGLTERRGTGEDSFWSWRELMYQFVERIGPEELEAVSALCFAEMLEAGFTHVGEFHYLHHQRDGTPPPTRASSPSAWWRRPWRAVSGSRFSRCSMRTAASAPRRRRRGSAAS